MPKAILVVGLAGVLALLMGPAGAQSRLPTISPQQYSDEQKRAVEQFVAARQEPLFGPFEPLLYSPQVMSATRAMGDYLRYHAAIGKALGELAILVTAREWAQDYEWHVHYPRALKAGIGKDIADAIADGRRPAGMSADEEAVYDFCTELHKNRRVSDRTFERVEKRFGRKGVVDLTGINGYYTLLAMQMNVARYAPAQDAGKLPRFPE